MEPQALQLRMSAVPEPIKIWFGSDVVVDAIENLYQKFNLDPQSRVIPKLLLRLEIQDLAARHFWAELASQLKLTKETAKPVVEEIRGRILNPIQKDLEATGIKLDELNIFEAAPAEEIPKGLPTPMKIPSAIPAPTRLPAADAAPEEALPPMDLPFTIAGSAPAAAPKPLGALPVDKPAAPVAAPSAPPPVAMPGATSFDNNSGIKPVEQKRGFRFGIPGLRFGEMKAGESSSRNAQLEIGQKVSPLAKNFSSKVGEEAPRVVHYSQWKTPTPVTNPTPVPGGTPAPGAPVPFSQLATLGNTPQAGSPAAPLKPSISPISGGPLSTPVRMDPVKPSVPAPVPAIPRPAPASPTPPTPPTPPISTPTPAPKPVATPVPAPIVPAAPEPTPPVVVDKKEGFLARVKSAPAAIPPAPEIKAPAASTPAAVSRGIPAPSFKTPAASGATPPPAAPLPPTNTPPSPQAPEVIDLGSL